MLAELEAALIARVKAVLNGNNQEVCVAGFPGADDERARPGRQGQILIGYKRSRFQQTAGEPLTLNTTAEFEVALMLRDLRTHIGAYPILDLVRRSLTGYWVPCDNVAGKCYPVQEGFLKIDEGIWYYSQTFALPLMLIEEPIEESFAPTSIGVGLHRSKAGNLLDNTLDRELNIRITE